MAKKLVLLAGGLLLGLAVCAGAVRLAGRTGWRDGRTEVLIVGLDGADWNVINPLLAAGEMPHLKQLVDEGVRADLISIRPMLSPRIWTTIASGKLPEEHGVKDFYADSRMVRTRRLWDILELEGWSLGLFGWPITWPPRAVDGFVVPDWMARGTETHPPELGYLKEMEIAARSGGAGLADRLEHTVRSWAGGVSATTLLSGATFVARNVVSPQDELTRYEALRGIQVRLQAEAFARLRNRYQPRFAAFYSDAIDKLCHRFWKYHDPEAFPELPPEDVERYGSVIADAYRLADWSLGHLLRDLDDEATVVVVSDHGFQSSRKQAGVVLRLRVDAALDLVPGGSRFRSFKVNDRVYLRAPGDARATDAAHRALQSAAHEPTGGPLFDLTREPDGSFSLALRQRSYRLTDGIRIGGKVVSLSQIAETEVRGGGEHREKGIFVMRCPDCRRDQYIGRVRAQDVTPTLLYTLGVAVGADMKGRAVRAVLRDDASSSRPVQLVETWDDGFDFEAEGPVEDKRMESLLRSVGYVE